MDPKRAEEIRQQHRGRPSYTKKVDVQHCFYCYAAVEGAARQVRCQHPGHVFVQQSTRATFFDWDALDAAEQASRLERRVVVHDKNAVPMCVRCVRVHGYAVCRTCYERDWGQEAPSEPRLCFACRETQCRDKAPVWRFCTKCYVTAHGEEVREAVTAEAAQYLERRQSVSAGPTGREPALQLLMLPQRVPLPAYLRDAEYLSPWHCRLCFAAFPAPWERVVVAPSANGEIPEDNDVAKGSPASSEATRPIRGSMEYPSDPAILEHLRSAHGLDSYQAYRKEVFSRVLGCPLAAISNQTIRCRLAAYKKAMCDARFLEEACGVCGAYASDCEACIFPRRGSASPPSWLNVPVETWVNEKESWWDAIDGFLSVRSYWERYFLAPRRIADAKSELELHEGL